MAEYTPELNESVLAALRRKIKEEEAQQLASAQGAATARGIAGSTYQATREGLANKNAINAITDAEVQLALENANRLREERLLAEDRAHKTAELEKERAFQASQAEISRNAEADAVAAQNRMALLSSGLEGVLGFGGNVGTLALAKKFGLFGGMGGSAPSAVPGVANGIRGASALYGGSGPGATLLAGGGAPAGGMGLFAKGGLAGLGLAAQYGQHLFARKNLGVTSKEGQLLSWLPGGALQYGLAKKGIGATATNVSNAAKSVSTNVRNVTKKLFCFDPWTEVVMADGSTELIRDINLGDKVKGGGDVCSIRWSKTDEGTRYMYHDVIVTGSHAVKEDGKWIRVKDSKWARPLGGEGTVVSLVTENHRIVVKGSTGEIMTADEHETDDYEYLTIDESLAKLNEEVLV